MRNALACLVTLGLLSSSPAHARTVELGDGRTALEPIIEGALAVMPVVASQIDARPDVLTFDEATKAGLVKVQEESEGGTVNVLRVENRGRKPVLILAGEVVQGGKQDRVLGQDTVLAPGEKREVQAYCVEHGRWSGGRDFKSGGWAANASVRYQAKSGNQQGVWNDVEKRLAGTGAKSDTQNLKAASERDAGRQDRALANLKQALERLPARDRGRVVGYVAAVGGKIVSVDLFAHPSLAERYRDKLLRSYVLESVAAPAGAPAAVSPEAIGKLRAKSANAPAKTEKRGDYAMEDERGDGVVRSRIKDKSGKDLVDSMQAH
jgi:hypothetical protein